MNSGTSTKPIARQTPRALPSRADGDSSGIQVWHFYMLLSMIGATAAVIVSRNTHPVALLLLSAAAISAGWVGFTLHGALTGFFSGAAAEAPRMGARLRESLVREKALVLRSIKELEFDHAMGKVSGEDFADIGGRLRERAIALMQDLDRQDAAPVRRADERQDVRQETAPVAPAERDAFCPNCGTPHEDDANFCKRCGRKLSA
jgi:hypothetical protein